MTKESPKRIYSMTTKKKLIMFAVACVGALIGGIIAASVLSGKSTTIPIVAIGIGVVLGSSQKVYTTSEEVVVKMLLGKGLKFLYSDGTFSIETLTGAKSLLMTFSPKAQCLYYTPKATGKKRAISFVLSDEDVKSLYQEIKERAPSSVA